MVIQLAKLQPASVNIVEDTVHIETTKNGKTINKQRDKLIYKTHIQRHA